jgi:hypothetical protein
MSSDAGGLVKLEGEAPQTQPPSQPGDDSEDHRRQSQSSTMEIDEPACLVCGAGVVVSFSLPFMWRWGGEFQPALYVALYVALGWW